MKNFFRIFSSGILFFALMQTVNSQTNVSGGIFSNTTWTQANSPYIVTDTVVVFPGVTLTIQPGVVVKFDNNVILEIRQARLIAVGTAVDSITFTSNSAFPTPGIYWGVFLNGGTLASQFNYCNFLYAYWGIWSSVGSVTVKNSNFRYNNYGMNGGFATVDSCTAMYNTNLGLSGTMVNNCISSNNGGGINGDTINNCVISFNQSGASGNVINSIITNNQTGIGVSGGLVDNCTIKYNQTGVVSSAFFFSRIKNCVIDSNSVEGIKIDYSYFDTIYNCLIRYNGIGIYDSSYGGNVVTKNIIENNTIGIRLGTYDDSIFCNKICNSTLYDLLYYGGAINTNASNNYWCTPDSASTTAVIYDGYDNINLGLVNFMPLDTSQCYLGNPTAISESENSTYNIYPNPTVRIVSIQSSEKITSIIITNILGGKVYTELVSASHTTIDLSKQHNGIYFLHINTPNGIAVRKIVKE